MCPDLQIRKLTKTVVGKKTWGSVRSNQVELILLQTKQKQQQQQQQNWYNMCKPRNEYSGWTHSERIIQQKKYRIQQNNTVL